MVSFIVRWEDAEFPHLPRDVQSLQIVDAAWLSQVQQGRLRTFDVPNRWLTGAVYDSDRRLVVSSQKIGGLGGNQGVMADPGRYRRKPPAEELRGTWLYGGHWINHFAHFFTETATTLWPERAEWPGVDGLVFHKYFGRDDHVASWQQDLIDLAGWGGLPIRVINKQALAVERLIVPSRSVVVNGWAHAGSAHVWRRMATAAGDAGAAERVYFSRTSFNRERRAAGLATRTDADRDEGLDGVFTDAGFAVVNAEELTPVEQIRLAAGARVLAGLAGSALHLAAFAAPGARVLEIGDERSPGVHVPQQAVINAACGHRQALIPHEASTAAIVGQLHEMLRRS